MAAPSPEEETLERSLARTPRQPDLWIQLGLARAKRGADAEAEAAYRQVLEQDPDSAIAWQCLGLLREQQRRYAEAVDCFQASVDRGGARPALWANLAKLQHQTGRVEASLRSYAEAVRLEPGNRFYQEMRRKITFLRDVLEGPSVDAAIAGYRSSLAPEAVATDRELLELFQTLFGFLSAFGHREAALRLGRKHLELWPDSPWMDYLLQAVKGERGFDRSPPGYVAEHFDAFAAGFDAQLVGALGYDIPEKIAAALQAAGALAEPGNVLDVGCGTGLCAPWLRLGARTLIGVDLSPRMLEQAAKRGLYDSLACAELTAFLRQAPGRFFLLVAADVLVYVGDLGSFLRRPPGRSGRTAGSPAARSGKRRGPTGCDHPGDSPTPGPMSETRRQRPSSRLPAWRRRSGWKPPPGSRDRSSSFAAARRPQAGKPPCTQVTGPPGRSAPALTVKARPCSCSHCLAIGRGQAGEGVQRPAGMRKAKRPHLEALLKRPGMVGTAGDDIDARDRGDLPDGDMLDPQEGGIVKLALRHHPATGHPNRADRNPFPQAPAAWLGGFCLVKSARARMVVFPLMHWPIACLSLAAGLEIIMIVVMRSRVQQKVAAPFTLALAFASLWAIDYALELSTPGFADKLLLLKLRILFVPFLGIVWFEVAYRFAYGRACLRGWRLIPAAAIPVITAVVTWVPVPVHFLTFRDRYWLDVSGPLALLRYTDGPWAPIFYGYSYAITASAIVILWRALGNASWDRTARRLLLAAYLLGAFLNLAYVAHLFPPAGLNYTPVLSPLIYGLIALAFVRGRILDLAPVARAALIENLEDMLLVLDSSGRLVDLNLSASVGLRLAPRMVMGRQAEEVLRAWPDLLGGLRDGQGGRREVVINGAIHELSFLPVLDRHQRLQARILILRNIADRKRIEEEFRNAKEVAEAADQAKTSFLATISHEIRTPMNAVVGFTHLLQSTPLNAEQREYLNLIEQGGGDLLVIIDDVLDLSKITSGRLDLEEAPCAVAELAAHICSLLQPQAQKKGITLQWSRAPDTPEVIVGDSVRLGQILTNLVGNALKFTERGGVEVQVARGQPAGVAESARGRCVLEFRVRDTGIGIAVEAMERIFSPFSQADNSITRKDRGTGLGLAITRRLCELMHGELTVASASGQGSTFTARIEVGLLPDEEPTRPDPARVPAPVAADRPLRLLVAEDNRLNQRVLGADPQEAGPRGHLCRHRRGDAGDRPAGGVRRRAPRYRDAGHRRLRDGPAAAGERGRRPRRQYVIALTAHAMQGILEKCLAVGMVVFLTKPLDPTALRHALQRSPGQ